MDACIDKIFGGRVKTAFLKDKHSSYILEVSEAVNRTLDTAYLDFQTAFSTAFSKGP